MGTIWNPYGHRTCNPYGDHLESLSAPLGIPSLFKTSCLKASKTKIKKCKKCKNRCSYGLGGGTAMVFAMGYLNLALGHSRVFYFYRYLRWVSYFDAGFLTGFLFLPLFTAGLLISLSRHIVYIVQQAGLSDPAQGAGFAKILWGHGECSGILAQDASK